ncbi:RNA methyltransferase [Ottowia sp.]|uniref:RNA methyltransferase n=1 Tax=Ottowia sp. TaxID=1898956 RepID=UPI002BCBEBA2|nr:RNA methyltransferase [Ottowia sp.]HRN75215.1 RNA methyltransferase [Ottowia sp.]HRQ01664.1 RNA methyltransferase [Ottowia sp.]
MQPPRTRFILIETSHAGNVGAAARALKVMGFDELVLVAPRWPDVLTRAEAVERASGADDVLAAARVVPTLSEALDGMTHLCATAMTPRDFGPPTRAPREHFDGLLGAATGGEQAHEPPQGVAFLFGSERYGMKNEDVYRCHVALSIPTNPVYGSLNLAAAVQLIAYDWRMALRARFGGFEINPAAPAPLQADARQLDGMLAHWEQALVAIGFLDPAAPKKLMPRLQQLFNRAQPTQDEIHILRGIAKAVLQRAPAAPAAQAESAAVTDNR